jgi:hypothetical protein
MKIDTLGGLRRFIQSDEVKGLSDDAFFIPYCYNRGSEGDCPWKLMKGLSMLLAETNLKKPDYDG